MQAKKGNIVVSVDLNAKKTMQVGDTTLQTGKFFNPNFREKNPVIAYVLTGYGVIKDGMLIVCNYNTFDDDSPYLLPDNNYCIPVDEEIYAYLDEEGIAKPICDNLVIEAMMQPKPIDVGEEYQKRFEDRGTVKYSDNSDYKPGEFILFLFKADLEMIYYWRGEERRFIRIHSSEIVGRVINKNP